MTGWDNASTWISLAALAISILSLLRTRLIHIQTQRREAKAIIQKVRDQSAGMEASHKSLRKRWENFFAVSGSYHSGQRIEYEKKSDEIAGMIAVSLQETDRLSKNIDILTGYALEDRLVGLENLARNVDIILREIETDKVNLRFAIERYEIMAQKSAPK